MVEPLFNKTIDKYKLLKKKDTVVLGISGGPDSMCMLHLFCGLRQKLHLSLICAHFNHGLRKDADSDEAFVRIYARKKHITFASEKKDVARFWRGDSLEQAARNARYDFFLNCTRRFRARKIALAHNKDEVAETVLMKMIRGSALRGLRGILPASTFRGKTVIRPLLAVTKSDILAYCKKCKIPYRVDATNLQEKFLRNKIRRKLIPLLKECNPNITGALYNLARTVSLDYDYFYSLAQKEYNAVKKSTSRSVRLKRKALVAMHPALLASVVRLGIEEIKGNLRRLESRHLDEILDLIYNRPPGSIVHLIDIEVIHEDTFIRIKSLIL